MKKIKYTKFIVEKNIIAVGDFDLKCLNPNVRWVRVDLVAGKTTDRIYCDTARKWLLHTDGFNTCGPKAKYFEPK